MPVKKVAKKAAKKTAPKAVSRPKAPKEKSDPSTTLDVLGGINVIDGVAKVRVAVELKVCQEYQSAGVVKEVTATTPATEAEDAMTTLSGHLRDACLAEIPTLRSMIDSALG